MVELFGWYGTGCRQYLLALLSYKVHTKMNIPVHVLQQLYETCSTQKQAMEWLRRTKYKFSDKAFREAWRKMAAGERPSLPGLEPDLPAPARPRPVLGRVARIETGAELEPEKPERAGGWLHTADTYRPTLNGKRFVFTCAQNNTLVYTPFFDSLLQFCKAKKAQLGVAKITYNIAGWNKRSGLSHISKRSNNQDADVWYDPRLEPYWIDEQVKVAPGLLFCGEIDILPTMQNPLTGFDNYTGTNSAIIPHVKMHMRSLATMKHEDAKFLYTTGTVTLRNYIHRRLGQLASFNHVYGAVYVEVDDAGNWFARQINADDDGCFYELGERFHQAGRGDSDVVQSGDGCYINLGDVHAEKLDPSAWSATKEMLEHLSPGRVFVHDLADFTSRNHHNIADPWFLAKMGNSRVEDDIRCAAAFLFDLQNAAPTASLYVVQSNHDDALTKWLKTQTPIADAGNKWYWHQLNAWAYRAIQNGESPDIFKRALRRAYQDLYGPVVADQFPYFIGTDESLVLREIEFGMHGHLGPNGARGNPAAFRQIGRKANTGHTHSAGIVDGVWTAGVMADLDMGYNVGPSSWSHSHIVTYPNGKRTIITIKKGKWRA